VWVIDASAEKLALRDLGFTRAGPLATDRPAHLPAALLKRNIYGHLYRLQSGRRLERAHPPPWPGRRARAWEATSSRPLLIVVT
jgi:hypothetical protein